MVAMPDVEVLVGDFLPPLHDDNDAAKAASKTAPAIRDAKNGLIFINCRSYLIVVPVTVVITGAVFGV